MTIDLVKERLDRGLSIRQAAEKMGVAANTLARAEAGEFTPHPANALKIADFYGFKVTDVWPVGVQPTEATA